MDYLPNNQAKLEKVNEEEITQQAQKMHQLK